MVEYTIDDIRGPTVAREMAQLKTFVLDKFNGAIADAEAAAAQAATDAANAVLNSLDTRVGVLEGDMTTAQGDIITNANAILALDGAVVKLAGAQTIPGVKEVPLEATGTASNQIASSQKVKNELDNYDPMVRNTGNKTISGIKTFTNSISGICGIGWNETSGSKPSGTYQVLLKIPKTALAANQTPLRGHLIVAVCIRANASGIDVLDISTNSSNLTGIQMALPRGMGHNVTYIASEDTDYWYISRINLGNSLDGISCEIIASFGIGINGSLITAPSSAERELVSVPGTEKGRVNNT